MTAAARAKSLSGAVLSVSQEVEAGKLMPAPFHLFRPDGTPGCAMGHCFDRAGWKMGWAKGAVGFMLRVYEAEHTGDIPPNVFNALGSVMSASDNYALHGQLSSLASREELRDRLVQEFGHGHARIAANEM